MEPARALQYTCQLFCYTEHLYSYLFRLFAVLRSISRSLHFVGVPGTIPRPPPSKRLRMALGRCLPTYTPDNKCPMPYPLTYGPGYPLTCQPLDPLQYPCQLYEPGPLQEPCQTICIPFASPCKNRANYTASQTHPIY